MQVYVNMFAISKQPDGQAYRDKYPLVYIYPYSTNNKYINISIVK